MEKGYRLQVTLSQKVAKSLDSYCEEKGVKRSAVVTMAINRFLEEETADKRE